MKKGLLRCPLFHGISEEELTGVLACLGAQTEHFAKGEIILAEGEPARRLGILLKGSAQVIREDYFGNRSIMTHLETADLFAEAFVCAGVEKMPLTVVAMEDTEALLIDGRRILTTCSNACNFHRQLIFNLMRILATKNLMCNQKIEITSKRSTREKLMAYLMIQAKKNQSTRFAIPYDRQELADYLEVDRSGLSSEIGKLRREGVLECRKNHFELLMEEP
ncbi:MAG: Crp/Fnr family transcriptional regulator [Clostridia bacterium]|nr:Crp/Fnr family transcriptional regulator [Clostridia bacterium]